MKLPAERILVRCPNWVGDMVMATPVLRCLRENYPAAHITLMLRPYVRNLVAHSPWHDDVVETERAGETFGSFGFRRTIKELRSRKFDLGLILPNSFRSALVARLGRVQKRIGYARDARGWLLTHALPRPSRDGKFAPTYMGDYYLALCEHIGCEIGERHPELFTTPGDDAAARNLLAEAGVDLGRPLVLICPGASFGSSKHWPTERWAKLADMLAEGLGVSVVVTGGEAEVALAHELVSLCQRKPVNLAGAAGGLALLKAVVKLSDLMVTVDSGSRHVALAFGRPTVVLMGPTHPGYTQTSLERGEVIRFDVDCGPCQQKGCATDHRCMTLITPECVLESCQRVLGG